MKREQAIKLVEAYKRANDTEKALWMAMMYIDKCPAPIVKRWKKAKERKDNLQSDIVLALSDYEEF